jgi:hypothetical protein
MVQAANEATLVDPSPTIRSLTVPEAQALADRLFSRSASRMFVASPEVRRDLCVASRAIRSMISTIDKLASQCEDTAHLLRARSRSTWGAEMVGHVKPAMGLMFTFTRDGEVVEQQIANSPARCCQMAVVFLAGLGALQGGDRLEVADVDEA